MRHAFSTLSLSIPLPPNAGTSHIEHDTSRVNNFVIDTTDNLSENRISQNEEYEEQLSDNIQSTAIATLESCSQEAMPENEAPYAPDIYISGLRDEDNVSSFKRRSILFSDNYSHSGSFDDGPSLPISPPPGPLISPRISTSLSSAGFSSPRLSWLFSPTGTNVVNFSDLSADPPELPLSPPPGKTLSPRASTTFVNTDPLNLIPGSSMPLSTLLRLPLAEIVMHELEEETNEGLSNGKKPSQGDESPSPSNAKFENKPVISSPSFKNDDGSKSTKGEATSKDGASIPIVSQHLTKLETTSANLNADSGVDCDGEHAVMDKKQLTALNENLQCDIHSTIENFMKSSVFTGSSEYNSDPTLTYFTPRRESSSTAPTEISNTSDDAGNVLFKSNSTNSLNTFTTESEDDTFSRSTAVTITASSDVGNRVRAFSDTTVPGNVESKHVAKAGILEMKRILVHRNQVVAMASRKRWKKYWAKLKGSTLLFCLCENISSMSDEAPVSLRIDVEGCIAHPEHMKRDNVICLSTSVGDTYYLQTTSQAEVDSWIRTIHSVAVISLTKHLIKEESVHMLKNRQKQIEEMIDSENKLKKLAELQFSISDPTSKAVIANEVEEWSKTIERLHVELYRHRCYLASLQATELPNPQSLLANVLKSTKTTLVKLDTFSVASVHAKVCARHGGMLLNLCSLQAKKSTSSLFRSSLGGSMNLSRRNVHAKKKTGSVPRIKAVISRPLLSGDSVYAIESSHTDEVNDKVTADLENVGDKDDPLILRVSEGQSVWTGLANFIRVKLPDGQTKAIGINETTTMNDVLVRSCEKKGINNEDYFIQLRHETDDGELETAIPAGEDLLNEWQYSYIEVIQKLVYTLKLEQLENENSSHFGMIIIPKYSDKIISRLFVERVIDDGPADIHGIIEGDEIVRINQKEVIGMKPLILQQYLRDKAVTLTIKSSTIEVPSSVKEVTTTTINELVLPAPPQQDEITEDVVKQLIIPNPYSLEDSKSSLILDGKRWDSEVHLEEVDSLLKESDALNRFVHSMKEYSEDEPYELRHLSTEEKLCKCMMELLETEQEYIKDLNKLVSRYLIPLKAETFITPTELTVLFGDILEITEFQEKFLQHLELILEDISSTSHHEHMQGERIRRVLFSVAGTFIFFLDHFKLYSTFCASHCQAQEVLRQANNKALQQFLAARNPKNEHTLTLESLLIKPIQRVLRYPLFLKAMRDLTPHSSDERNHLIEAIKGMDKVADYINEMQRIHDLYSPLFNKLMSQSQSEEVRLNLTIGQLLHKCEVMWLNPPEELAKGWKKGHGPEVLCFVFISAIVITLEKKRTRKHSKGSILDVEEVKFSVAIPLALCSMFDLPDSDGVTDMWQLVHKSHMDPKPIRYLFRSLESEKNEVLQVIKEKGINSNVIQL